jgi:hypothetical protein
MDPTAQMTDLDQIRQFILAGDATFTVVSKRTGERKTFKTQLAPKNDRYPNAGYFVRSLVGPDNENDYRYVGFVYERNSALMLKVSTEDQRAAAVRWLLTAVNHRHSAKFPGTASAFESQAEFWHAGRCGKCGRTLTTPESVARGLGPTCAGVAQ